MYKLFFKRIFDIATAFIGFVILSPIFFILILLLFIFNSGKVFFIQQRPGRNGILFKIIKFKTMNDKKDIHGKLFPDMKRLTCIGKFIRKTSFDEIPQLINVIKGDMSLVGPRPLLIEYLSLYDEEQKRRHEIRPGITGWAQINGRNVITWKEKFKLDVWYVDNVSFWVDIKILFITVKKVCLREGISSKTTITMEKFTG